MITPLPDAPTNKTGVKPLNARTFTYSKGFTDVCNVHEQGGIVMEEGNSVRRLLLKLKLNTFSFLATGRRRRMRFCLQYNLA